MKTMKINLDLITFNILAIGLFLLFINPGTAIAADSIYDVAGTKQVTLTKSPAHETGQSQVVSRSDENGLQPERRMRLQTVENIVRSQQTIRRTVSPRM